MKHPSVRRTIVLLLSLLMLAALIPLIALPASADDFPVVNIEVIGPIGFSEKYFVKSIDYMCTNGCERHLEFDPRIPGRSVNSDVQMAVVNDLSEIDRIVGEKGYCEDCYEDYLCVSCYREKEECELYCEDCHKCNDCWDKNIHCDHCGDETDICEECKALDDHRCDSCHDLPPCEGCNRCLVAAEAMSERCMEGGNHCVQCDEPYICDDCGSCFFDRGDIFCDVCEMCLACGVNAGLHCRVCSQCLDSETDPCEGDDTICRDCCVEEGNHCEICDNHVETWCDGGRESRHCRDCAEDNDWVCDQCGRCKICYDFEFCEDCGLCGDCCTQNIEEAGCVCREYCVESDDFYGEDHLCSQCFASFSCVDEFCDSCGLCRDCCELNADEYGCVCGLCVADDDFLTHLCEQCGLPTCERGDFCDECGLCESCCLENSEAEGCVCGICVENSDFEDPDHKCTECGAFSCQVDFCDHCGLCQDCCEARAYTDYGCSHGVCVEDPDWEDHYCEDCGKCKEDCGCGQACCEEPWTGWSGHGTDTEIGTIFIQPTDKKKSVTSDNRFDMAENTVVFRVRAYDPDRDLTYQWYRRVDGGEGEPLADDSLYLSFRDETLVFVAGAETDTLTVAVPSDACHIRYTYYCVIRDPGGEVLSVSDEAKLVGAHSYAWRWTDEDYHQQVCIGLGCTHKKDEAKKAHEIGPWRYVRYASENLGALITRSCNVCGGVSESRETAPLGTVHTAHEYLCIPVEGVNANGDPVCTTHIRQCDCGRTDGGEEPHVWGRWIVTKQANDHHRGSKYRECMLCRYRETQEIPLQTHEHEFNLHVYDAEFYRIGADDRYHWQYCGDEECEAVAFKEEHTYSHWFFETEAGPPQLEWRDATLYRYCEVCGYVQERTVKEGNRPLCFNRASASVISADHWDSDDRYTFTVTAKPPVGWYFVRWEDVGSGRIVYEEYYETDSKGDPKRDEDGNIIWKRYNKYDETIVITLDHYDEDDHFLGLNTIYELDAVCERYNNDLQVYYNDGNSNVIDYGSKLTQSELDGRHPEPGEPWVLWYEKQEEDEYGYRTVTVRLNNYDGGPLVLLDKGLPCDLHIIVEDDSRISTNDMCFGILGCYTGGSITVSSETGAELTINVRNGSKLQADAYGIKARRDKKWYSDKITLSGNLAFYASVTNPKPSGDTYGLYSSSWVEILDDASAEIAVISYAYRGEGVSYPASGIRAKKEIQIDTTGHLHMYLLTDVTSDQRARPLNAKNIVIGNVGEIEVTYPANSRHAYRREPDYDHRAYILTEADNGQRNLTYNGVTVKIPVKTFRMEPAWPVTIRLGGGASVDVPGRYRNDLGDYMVPPGESIVFYTAPEQGRYDEGVWVDGQHIKRGETDDGVRTKYVIGPIDGPLSVEVSSGLIFKPFASQPELTQSAVYYGSEARLSYRMNDVLQVLKSHEKFSGTAAEDPNFALGGTTGHFYSGKLIQNSITRNRIYLQRWNGSKGTFESTGISFAPSIVGTVSFNDTAVSSSAESCRYRLMVLYDGQEYYSDEFTVDWSDDPADLTEARAAAVEIYAADSKMANGASCEDGGAWVRLDSETELLVYDVSTSGWVGRAMSRGDYTRYRKTRDLLVLAEFDYHTGILTLNGDLQYADFDGSGEAKTYDLGDKLIALRVPDDTVGTLVLDVKADTTIAGDYEAFGWEGWYGAGHVLDHMEHNYAQEYVILTEGELGTVRIRSDTGAELWLGRWGSEQPKEYFRSYYGISADGDVILEGDVRVRIFLEISDTSGFVTGSGAHRYGVTAGGTLRVKDQASLRISLPVTDESFHLRGDAAAVYAAAVELTGDSVTVLECNARELPGLEAYTALGTESLTVTGAASLTVTGRGNIPTAVLVDGDTLLATEGTVRVSALGDGDTTSPFGVTGQFSVTGMTTLFAEYRDGTEEAALVSGAEPFMDGGFVRYHADGRDNEVTGLAEEHWIPGVPYTLTLETDPGAEEGGWDHTFTHEVVIGHGGDEIFRQMCCSFGLDVAAGDRVTYTAAEAITGYEFAGWVTEESTAPDDISFSGRTVTFTMPARDLSLHATYRCIAFETDPPSFVVTKKEGSEGLLTWRVDTGAPNVDSVDLEVLTTNAEGESEWVSYRYYEDGDWHGWDLKEDMETYLHPITGENIYTGTSLLGREGMSDLPRLVRSDPSALYRIHFNGNVSYYSDPFVLDFEGGVHILLSQDRENTELAIPAGYVGSETLVDLSKYLYAAPGRLSYSLTFSDLMGPIASSVCEARMFENGMLRFVRNGAHSPIYGIEGGTAVTVTDEETGRSYTIPFDFGEIYDTEVYPVWVGGIKVTAVNRGDVLGDGTVSYDPETKTLTLDHAQIGEIYGIYSEAGLTVGAYAIVCVEDITIRLVGENAITASRNSFCHSQAYQGKFNGTAVGIGNVVNDKVRPYLDEEDDFRITFTGDGSLAIELEGDCCTGISSIGDITIDGPSIMIDTEYSGLMTEFGSFTMNAGSLDVDAGLQCCVEICDTDGRFTMNGGRMHLNGGTGACVISLGPETYANAENVQLIDGDLILETKSATYDLCSRGIYCSEGIYSILDREGRNASDLVEAPDSIQSLDYLKYTRRYLFWVNGEQFTSEKLSIRCGGGTATLDPEANTITLHNAEITKGVAFQSGPQMAAGICAFKPVDLVFTGYGSRIDLSSREYYTQRGEPYGLLDGETENSRMVCGILIEDQLAMSPDPQFGLYGSGQVRIEGIRYGIYSYNENILCDGPSLLISGCEGGLDGEVTVSSGAISIEARDYSVYGTLDAEDYEPLYVFGGATRNESVLLDWPSVDAGNSSSGWGYDYPYLKISPIEVDEMRVVLGEIASENAGETAIRVNRSALPTYRTVKITVAQYQDGRFLDMRSAEAVPGEDGEILLTFETAEDATYRIFVHDAAYRPLLAAFEIDG